MTSQRIKKGNLLIAEPSIIGDSNFNRAVILLADLNATGTIGFIINKQLSYTLKDLIKDTLSNFAIYNGGPVDQDNLYFVHNKPELIPESIEISDGLFWGGDFEIALSLVNSHGLTEQDIRFFLGYSGWDTEQLTQEIQENSWLVSPNIYAKNLLEHCDSGIWKQKMLELDDNYSIWSNAPEHPSYN